MSALYSCDYADECIFDIFISDFSTEMAGRNKINIEKGSFLFLYNKSFQVGTG